MKPQTWTCGFAQFVKEDSTTSRLFEASITRVLKPIKDKSFGIITGGDEDANKLLEVALAKAGYTALRLDGEFVKPAKKKDDDDIHTPDASLVVIGTNKEEDVATLRKFLFRNAERFGQQTFAFKPAKKTNLFVVGVSDEVYPGRHIAKPLGTYSPDTFLSLLQAFKGDHYVFGSLHE